MAAIYKYYDEDWRKKTFECPNCGWKGTHAEMDGPNIYQELTDFCCAKCEKMLLIIGHPNMSETIEAAAAGNEHALFELGVISRKGEHFEKFKQEIEESNQKLKEGWKSFAGPKALIG